MADEIDFQAELRAIERLGWSANDTYLAALHYGDVGTCEDVAEHLRTGDHLPPEKKIFIAVALRDAELDAPRAEPSSATTDAGTADRRSSRWPNHPDTAGLVLLVVVAAVVIATARCAKAGHRRPVTADRR